MCEQFFFWYCREHDFDPKKLDLFQDGVEVDTPINQC